MKDGQRIHVSGYERRGDNMLLHLYGGHAVVPAADVLRVEPEDVFLPAESAPAPGPYGDVIAQAARKNGLDRHLLRGVIHAESDFRPRAVSPKGALGLMQLMPATARRLSVQNPYDPSENVQAGAKYLKQLLNRFGNLNLALAAYNAGPARVSLYGGIPPFPETRAYISRVRRDMAQKATGFAKTAPTQMLKAVCAPQASRCRQEATSSAGQANIPQP